MKPGRTYKKKDNIILVLGFISMLVLVLYLSIFPGSPGISLGFSSSKAADIMEMAEGVISNYSIDNDLIEASVDPGRTGLIGPEYSEITTTIGHLEAKRTTTNPVFADLIYNLLLEAGVSKGDTIAVACSGSFPALMIASLSAATAMEVHARLILSLGSSSFGANRPDFTILDMYNALQLEGIFDSELVAVSLGGEKDMGLEFETEIRNTLIEDINRSNSIFLYESNLQTNVAARYRLYTDERKTEIKAFISCGGSYSSMGSSALSLHLKPGLVLNASLPSEEQMGTVFSLLNKDIPVIHLLYIKGLCQKYGIPWDPVSDLNLNKEDSKLYNIFK